VKQTTTFYDVRVLISPQGGAQKVQGPKNVSFGKLNADIDHDVWRWVVVNIHGQRPLMAMDLWQTMPHSDYPYVVPHWVEHQAYYDVDYVIGFIVMKFC